MATVNNTDPSAGLNTGDIVDCTVEQIMPYGVFVRIAANGRKGMIHISELSYGFVKDINEIVKIHDSVKAKVIKIDERGRIDLSLKQTTEPPAPQPQKFSKPATSPSYERRENFKPQRTINRDQNASNVREPRELRETRDFFDAREAYRESHPEEADTFEKKMASFLKTSEAKITDLNTRKSARSGRSTRRRNSRDF